MPTGFGTAALQSSERIAHVNERIAVSKMVAATRARTGAKWFYWIAVLSIINSLIVFYGEKFDLGAWLGFTSAVDALVKRAGSAGSISGIAINALVAGVFITFGYFATKAKRWAFLVGMALYLVDGFLLIERRHLLSVGFHTYALYAISRGLAAAKQVQIQI
ncbi:MAG TPA: hypothetical protein VEK33_07410 [Terriglobales bacterium]|nr:hypothetical protein [Terriglobales bacterium]